jgi:glycosyltransferase involved in cell wall biosynthesis
MKKICHIIFEHHPLDGRVFYKEAVSLASAGYEVFILAPSLDGKTLGRKKEVDLQGKSFLEKSSVKLVPYHYNKNLPKQLGIRDYFTIKAIVQKALEIDADAYHFHEDKVSLEVFDTLTRIAPKKKFVYDFHEFFIVQCRKRYRNSKRLEKYLKYEEKIIKRSDLILVLSDFIGEYYLRMGAKNVKTVMNCQSKEFMKANPLNECKAGIFYVCHEGRLQFDRGLKIILEVAKIVDDPEIKFMILGKIFEQDSKYFNDYVKKHNLNDRFLITKWQPYDKISSCLVSSKLGLCFTLSLNSNFGVSNKFWNYLSAGIPILAISSKDVNEILREYNCGLIFQENDYIDIANAIVELKNNSELYQELSNNSLRAFETEYNWEKMAEILISAYRSLE